MAWPSLQYPRYSARSRFVEEEPRFEPQPLNDSQYYFQAWGSSSSLPPYKNGGLETKGGGAQQINLTQLEETAPPDLRPFVPTQSEAVAESSVLWTDQEQYGQIQPLFLPEVYAPLPLMEPTFQFQLQGDFSAGHNPGLPMPLDLKLPQEQFFFMEEPKERRKLCCEEGCKSQARALGRCKRHGGSKRCMSIGCDKSVQSRGLCIRHGGGSRCRESGCTRASQSFGKCKLHGGGRPCSVTGCKKGAHLKRLCRKHGGGIKCCITECDKWAQRQGMCMKHVKELLPPDENHAI